MPCWGGYTLEMVGGFMDGARFYFVHLPPTVTFDRYLPNGDREETVYGLEVHDGRFDLRYVNAQVTSRA